LKNRPINYSAQEAIFILDGSRDFSFGLSSLLREYELVDLGFLDERIKHVEDAVCAPNLRLG
jgi:hypothetical protein